MTSPRYIKAAEVARIIRKRLAQRFPTTKFEVKTWHSSTVKVTWTDGPTDAQVRETTDGFNGRGFDGMIDLAYSMYHWLLPDGSFVDARSAGTEGSGGSVAAYDYPAPDPAAELVRFESAHVTTSRNYSAALLAQAATEWVNTWADGDPSAYEIIPERQGRGYTIAAQVKTTDYQVERRIYSIAGDISLA